jgi:hypothetical protein
MSTAPSLDSLAIRHGADKSSLVHGYTRYYARYFAPLREEPIGHAPATAARAGGGYARLSFPPARLTFFYLEKQQGPGRDGYPGGVRGISNPL